MGKYHRAQHRQQKDLNTKIQREIEQENRRLRREVSRLRKELEKTEAPDNEKEAEDETKLTLKCPTCKDLNLASISTPSGKTRYACRACGWRGSLSL